MKNSQLVTSAAFTLTGAAFLALSVVASAGNDVTPESHSHVVQLAPCATEDSMTDCYWDADARGNGSGASFVVLGGTVYYADTTPTN